MLGCKGLKRLVWFFLWSSLQVHELCSSLLASHPTCQFVVVTLHTLSCLAVSSVIDIPKQVRLACYLTWLNHWTDEHMTSPCIVNTLFRELFLRVYKPTKILWLFIKYKENVAARGNNLKFIEFLSFFLVSKVLSVFISVEMMRKESMFQRLTQISIWSS